MLIARALGVRAGCSSDDAPVESLAPFEVQGLPQDIVDESTPLVDQLAGLGFQDPILHVVPSPISGATIYWATLRGGDGRRFARIHQRLRPRATPPRRGLFALFFTPSSDGTFVVSSSGKPDMESPPTVQMNRMVGALPGALWERHLALEAGHAVGREEARVASREDLVAVMERYHGVVRDFHLERKVFRPPTDQELVQAGRYQAAKDEARAQGLAEAEILADPPGLAALFVAYDLIPATNLEARASARLQAAPLLGVAPAAPGADAMAWFSGFVDGAGLTVEVRQARLLDPLADLPRVLQWLCGHGAKEIRYRFDPEPAVEEDESPAPDGTAK